MCGIFAAFRSRQGPDARPARAELERAVAAVAHRGPDHQGHHDDGACFLGHARLAIVGLERESHQPFHFEHLSITFNGEVFNYIELREELKREGYTFHTSSDTEVVIKAFHLWGERCFERFNGMWALAIHDRQKGQLVLSRDRFGQKPLFVMRTDEAFFVASEIHQLLPFTTPKADLATVQAFLKEGGYDSGRRTFFEGIEEFPKAHYAVVDAEHRVRAEPYWSYWSGPVTATSDEDLAAFERLLADAVRLRLRADVPLGVLLSGGVDSTVVATMAREAAGPEAALPAFTYATRDAEDESAQAARVAEALGLELHVHEQPQVPEEYRERLRRLVHHMGRGHSSPAIVSADILYESVARAGIRIALDGQGSDELLAGYEHYHVELFLAALARGRPSEVRDALVDLRRSGATRSLVLWLRLMMPEGLKALGRRAYGYEALFRDAPAPEGDAIVPAKPSAARNPDRLNRYLVLQHSLGLENLLFYGDITAMDHSVENRSPFLDHRLVDLAFSRDAKLKVHAGRNKHALRRTSAYARFRDVLDRPKIGFSSNIREGTKQMMMAELGGSPILAWPIFTPRLRRALENGDLARTKYERLLFRLYQVHLWHDVFFAARDRPGKSALVERAIAA